MNNATVEPSLRRVLNVPLLVCYGLGVTVGAGIFALIGEIVAVAGDGAPAAFLLAGIIAGATGISYSILSAAYPRAGGEAVFVNTAFGHRFGWLVGYGVTTTAIISSAVIALSFSGYLGDLLPVSRPILVAGVLIILASVACVGVRESVMFAALITVLEIGTLVVIIVFGSPLLGDVAVIRQAVAPATTSTGWPVILSASVIAFFAFIGFEDLVNMAEETQNPTRNMPIAIIATLLITVALYITIALIAVALPDRNALTGSSAPLATLFETVTGLSGKPIAAMASIAMVNGILIQIVMASRVIYGMTREGLAPKTLGALNARHQTPVRAIVLVTALIALLAFGFPLRYLAQATSLVTLTVFLLVNLALWRLGHQPDARPAIKRWRLWGLISATLTGGLLITEVYRLGSLLVS